MGTDQQYIDQLVKSKELVVQCCVCDKVRGKDGHYVGYRFSEPYKRKSHTYCPEDFNEAMALMDLEEVVYYEV